MLFCSIARDAVLPVLLRTSGRFSAVLFWCPHGLRWNILIGSSCAVGKWAGAKPASYEAAEGVKSAEQQ